MDPQIIRCWIPMLAAHLLGDFILQTNKDVTNKAKPLTLLKHGAIHGVCLWLLMGAWSDWKIPVIVSVLHIAVDWGKVSLPRSQTVTVFLVDQLLHLLIAWVAATFWVRSGPLPWWVGMEQVYLRPLLYLSGAIAAVQAGSYLVAIFVAPYLEELDAQLLQSQSDIEALRRGLTNAGSVIGKLERFLVYLLILAGVPTGVGFLVAAKSIFRFGELKETSNRMESEYILIGTLVSFLHAMLISYAVIQLASRI